MTALRKNSLFPTNYTAVGYNGDVDTGATEDVWTQGASWAAPTTARIHTVKSGSASDDSGAAGARTVLVEGLDANWAPASETVTLNGVSDVATAAQYIRVHKLTVTGAGSLAYNKGIVTATAQTDATVTCAIAAQDNVSRQAIFTIPAGDVGLIRSFSGNLGFSKVGKVNFTLQTRDNAGAAAWMSQAVLTVVSGPMTQKFDPPLLVTEKSDIRIRATVNSDNSECSAAFGVEIA